MSVDVIIPTFNRAGLVQRAIDSVLAQTYQDYHLYVIDDGSTDNTLEVLKTYESHPKVTLLSQSNQGVSAARNAAVMAGSSEWISFLDSDDEWLPQKLKAQTDFAGLNKKLRFFHAEEIWLRNDVRVNPKMKHSKSDPNIFERSLWFCLISPSTVMMKRDLFNEHHGFDESMLVCEDFDLWNKILATEEIGFQDFFVTKKYGGHADQLSTKYIAMDDWRIQSLLNLLEKDLGHEKDELIKDVLRKKSTLLLQGYLKHRDFESYDALLAKVSFLGLSL